MNLLSLSRSRKLSTYSALFLALVICLVPVLAQAAAISVNTNSVPFGMAQPGVPQMSLIPIRVTRDTTGFDPFTVRVYTQNYDGQAGLIGNVSPSNHLAVRCWVPNFGGGTGPGGLIPPDPTVGTNFADWWLRIPDESEMDPSNVYTLRRLEYLDSANLIDATMAPTPVGSYDVWFALDVRTTTPAEFYSTSNLVFEILNQ